MASDAAAPRDDELAGYSAEELVALLRTTRLSSDFDAVARVLRARERRAAQVEAELESRDKQAAEFSDSVAMIAEETQAKLKASLSKFHGPLKKAGHDAVPSGQETPDCMALTLVTTSSIPVAEQSKGKQPVMEMVKVSEGGRAAADADADGSAGKSLKRKADAVENRGGVSPVQISGELQERTVATGTSPPPGFSPITQFISSSSIYEEGGGPSSYSSLSQAIMVSSSEVSKEMSSMGGSCKTLTIKGPNNILEKTGEEQTTQNQGADQEPTHLGGASSIMSLITVPVQQVARLDTATVSKRGRGRGRTGPKRKEKNNNVSRGSPLPCSGPGPGRGRGRGRGRSNTSANPALGGGLNLPASPLVAHTSAPAALGALTIDDLTSPRPVADTLAKRLLQSVVAARGLLNRPSPLVKAPRPQTAHKYPASLENGSETRNHGQVKMNNITSGYAILGTGHLLRPSPFIINTASRAEIHSIPRMGGKVTENLGICVENKADSVPVMDNGDEEGDVAIYSNDIGGTSPGY